MKKAFIFVFLFAFLLFPSFSDAGQGCCSYHGGQSYCDSSSGRWVCNDGTYSPSCTCATAPTSIKKVYSDDYIPGNVYFSSKVVIDADGSFSIVGNLLPSTLRGKSDKFEKVGLIVHTNTGKQFSSTNDDPNGTVKVSDIKDELGYTMTSSSFNNSSSKFDLHFVGFKEGKWYMSKKETISMPSISFSSKTCDEPKIIKVYPNSFFEWLSMFTL